MCLACCLLRCVPELSLCLGIVHVEINRTGGQWGQCSLLGGRIGVGMVPMGAGEHGGGGGSMGWGGGREVGGRGGRGWVGVIRGGAGGGRGFDREGLGWW